MKKAAMFDLDGTLINSLVDIAGSMNRVLERNGLKAHPVEAYKLFTGDGALNLTRRALGERKDLVDTVYRQYREEYAAHSRDQTKPYDGIPEMLKALKQHGFRIIVLSNKDNSDAENVVRHYFPHIVFDAVQGKLEGYNVKPDPALGNLILSKLGRRADEIWYVGDTQTDMRCARALGAESIAVTWGFQTKEMLSEAQPAHYVDSPQALSELIVGKK